MVGSCSVFRNGILIILCGLSDFALDDFTPSRKERKEEKENSKFADLSNLQKSRVVKRSAACGSANCLP